MATSTTLVCHRCGGQALIQGLFVLIGGLAGLFFLFNSGQLVTEKGKLVNTADAVALSAGVMHARALNFDAYTNRALMANEILIAQAVSVASWTNHVAVHTDEIWPMYCVYPYWTSVPVVNALPQYAGVCILLSLPFASAVAHGTDNVVQEAAGATIALSEAAKTLLQGAQDVMAASLVPARRGVMEQVARANYESDGEVRIGMVGMTDNFLAFEGEPFIRRYGDGDRQRFKEVVKHSAYLDDFVEKRNWREGSPWPCIAGEGAEYRRGGGTDLVGLETWKSVDTASMHFRRPRFGVFGFRCSRSEYPLGYSARAATNGASPSGGDYGDARSNRRAFNMADAQRWDYSGLPRFYDLSPAGRNYQNWESNLERRNPRLRFSVALWRDKSETMTSEARSGIKPAGRLDVFKSDMSRNRLSAVATSEVFFRRPVPRENGDTELASLFNPFWETHLVASDPVDIAVAAEGEL